MKINENNFALGLLDNPDKFNFGFPHPDVTPKRTPEELKKFGLSFIEGSKHLRQLWEKNIQYISRTFFEAIQKSHGKLKEILYNEEVEDTGVLLTGGYTNGYTHTHTMYYVVYSVRDDTGKVFYNVLYTDFSRRKEAKLPALDVYISWFLKPGEENVDIKKSIWNGYIEDGRDEAHWVIFIIFFCLFKKFCDVETKVIEPKNRRAKVGGNKYLNETNKRIQVLDATWFTNLVVSGAFNVSGHLRWQRHGPNNSLKKLIWVDAFTKEGYTRKAKIIRNEEERNK